MKKFLFTLWLTLATHAPTQGVELQEIESLNAACAKAISKCELDGGSLAFGDINGDGLVDVAGFTGNRDSWTGPDNHVRGIVLVADSRPVFRVIATTAEIEVSMGTRPSLKIRDGSLFLEDVGSGGCCSRWDRSVQFRFKNNLLRLVGEEYWSGVTANELTPDDYGMSIKYLTDKAIAWRKNSKGRREFEVDFEMSPIFFDGFDFDHLREQQPVELQVYVDSDLELISLGE